MPFWYEKLYDWNILKQNFRTLKVVCPCHTILQLSATRTTQKILFFLIQLIFNKLPIVFFEVALIFLKMTLENGTGKGDKFHQKLEKPKPRKMWITIERGQSQS